MPLSNYDSVGKEDLSMGHLDPKRKLGETMHFSEIIKLQFLRRCCTTLLSDLKLSRKIIVA